MLTDMAEMAVLRVQVAPRRHPSVLYLTGEVDIATAPQLRSALGQILDTGEVCVVADLAGVTFLDNAGVRVFDDAARALRDRSGRLVLRHPDRKATKVLRIIAQLGEPAWNVLP